MSHPPAPVQGLEREGTGDFGSPCTSGGEPEGALAPMAAWAGHPQRRVQAGQSTLPRLQLGLQGGSESGPPRQARPGPQELSQGSS